jgi:hypothetical protein
MKPWCALSIEESALTVMDEPPLPASQLNFRSLHMVRRPQSGGSQISDLKEQ